MSLFDEAGLAAPTKPVMAATKWADNSEMIQAVRQLGYINDDDLVLDPTYQDGTWWKRWRPERLVTNSLDPANGADLCFDFRHAPFPTWTFDVVAYDPPYVSKGGRKTSTIQDHQRRYGLVDAPTSPHGLQTLINDGASDMVRVLRPGGILLVKCQDYVSSGKVWWGTDYTRRWIEHAHPATKAVDKLYYLNNGSAQPPRTRRCAPCGGTGLALDNVGLCAECGGTGHTESKQQHARVNVSVLWVFKKG